MVKVLIGLGANLGNADENLELATWQLANLRSTELISVSRWLRTAPIGGPPDQNEFLNGAALIETSLGPEELVVELQRIESGLGRQRIVRWGPRRMDLDVVLYGDYVVDKSNLQIPHPWMAMRRFVLEPAVQIASFMVHPRFGLTVGELYANLARQPKLIQITGLPTVDTTAAANWLAREVEGRLAYPLEMDRHASWELANGPSVDKAIELLDRWSGPLDVAANSPDTGSILVSDRWRGEILVVGEQHLGGADLVRLNEAWQARLQGEQGAHGKLLVVWEDTSAAAAAGDLSVLFGNRVRSPGHGPWLVLDAREPDRMRHDLLAAVNGMK